MMNGMLHFSSLHRGPALVVLLSLPTYLMCTIVIRDKVAGSAEIQKLHVPKQKIYLIVRLCSFSSRYDKSNILIIAVVKGQGPCR